MASLKESSPESKDTMAEALAKTWMRQYKAEANFPEWTKTQKTITEPLLLPDNPRTSQDDSSFSLKQESGCLLCDDAKFTLPNEQPSLLTHLFNAHKMVIGEVDLIADLPAYMTYWRNKFRFSKQPTEEALQTYCTVMKVQGEERDDELGVTELQPVEGGEYYFLSDVLAEDRELRLHLQLEKLQHVLDVQERERNDTAFSRSCLFCRSVFNCPRDVFNHMAFSHNFSVGQPDNLVFVGDLLDLLERRLNDLVCIFCEKVFKSRDVLKEHMRKKSHKKINPRNEAYDKFYIVNYLEFGKTWSGARKAGRTNDDFDDELPTGFENETGLDDADEDEEEEDDELGTRLGGAIENDWSDWRGDLSGAVCLFCPATYTDVNDLFNHMKVVHDFDFVQIKSDLGMGFYQQVKMINFVRRQVYLKKFPAPEQAAEFLISNTSEWNQSQYLFPTYENDNLLCLLEDATGGSGSAGANCKEDSPTIIPEDVSIDKESLLFEEDFRNSLLSKSDRQAVNKKIYAMRQAQLRMNKSEQK